MQNLRGRASWLGLAALVAAVAQAAEHSQYLAKFAQGQRLVDFTVDSHGGTVNLEIGRPD